MLGSCCCGEWLGDPGGSRTGAQHPGAPARVWIAPLSVRRRPEKSGEERRGWRDARALRTPSAPVGGPRGASAPQPAPLPPLSFRGPPFPPGVSGLKLLTLQCAHVGNTRNNRNCASLNCKESEGGSCQEPPPLVPLFLLGASTQHLGLKVWSGRAGASCDEVRILVKSIRKAFALPR